MGISYSVYVGPYVRARAAHGADLDYWAVARSIKGEMFHPFAEGGGGAAEDGATGYTWLPNVDRHAPRHFLIQPREEEPFAADMTHLSIAGEREWLGRAFAAEIEAMRKVYDDVDVCWGIVLFTT